MTVTSGYMSITTKTRPQYKGGDGMKLKDKKIEILAPHTVRDNEGFATTTLEPVDAPLWAYFRQRSFCGGNDQLQGKSAVHDKLPHGFNNRLRRAVQGRSVRYNPH